jgi:membrane protein YdbS with pleckstrin-like domain
VAEQTLWRGTSSQWKNALTFGICLFIVIAILVIAFIASQTESLEMAAPFILITLVLPIVIALTRYLRTRTKIYELTNERLKISEGIFGKVTDTLELYRVKDLETRQSFSLRLCGSGRRATEYFGHLDAIRDCRCRSDQARTWRSDS